VNQVTYSITSFKFGTVSEYNADGQYRHKDHIDELLTFLERLEENLSIESKTSTDIRCLFENVKKLNFSHSDIYECEKRIYKALATYAPDGYWFGNARANSNIVGFWPNDWLSASTPAPINSKIRDYGYCSFGCNMN
jgi:hypothetical protein